MLGHPFKKPFRVAFRSVDILGLHKDWCANFTLLAPVEMEWAKLVVCCTALGRTGNVGDCCAAWIGSVHKSVVASLYTCRMCFPLYIISQCSLQNVTVHPALHNTRTPISDAIDRLGTIWPVSNVGKPGIVMSQQ